MTLLSNISDGNKTISIILNQDKSEILLEMV
jgi:hypothetical protein